MASLLRFGLCGAFLHCVVCFSVLFASPLFGDALVELPCDRSIITVGVSGNYLLPSSCVMPNMSLIIEPAAPSSPMSISIVSIYVDVSARIQQFDRIIIRGGNQMNASSSSPYHYSVTVVVSNASFRGANVDLRDDGLISVEIGPQQFIHSVSIILNSSLNSSRASGTLGTNQSFVYFSSASRAPLNAFSLTTAPGAAIVLTNVRAFIYSKVALINVTITLHASVSLVYDLYLSFYPSFASLVGAVENITIAVVGPLVTVSRPPSENSSLLLSMVHQGSNNNWVYFVACWSVVRNPILTFAGDVALYLSASTFFCSLVGDMVGLRWLREGASDRPSALEVTSTVFSKVIEVHGNAPYSLRDTVIQWTGLVRLAVHISDGSNFIRVSAAVENFRLVADGRYAACASVNSISFVSQCATFLRTFDELGIPTNATAGSAPYDSYFHIHGAVELVITGSSFWFEMNSPSQLANVSVVMISFALINVSLGSALFHVFNEGRGAAHIPVGSDGVTNLTTTMVDCKEVALFKGRWISVFSSNRVTNVTTNIYGLCNIVLTTVDAEDARWLSTDGDKLANVINVINGFRQERSLVTSIVTVALPQGGYWTIADGNRAIYIDESIDVIRGVEDRISNGFDLYIWNGYWIKSDKAVRTGSLYLTGGWCTVTLDVQSRWALGTMLTDYFVSIAHAGSGNHALTLNMGSYLLGASGLLGVVNVATEVVVLGAQDTGQVRVVINLGSYWVTTSFAPISNSTVAVVVVEAAVNLRIVMQLLSSSGWYGGLAASIAGLCSTAFHLNGDVSPSSTSALSSNDSAVVGEIIRIELFQSAWIGVGFTRGVVAMSSRDVLVVTSSAYNQGPVRQRLTIFFNDNQSSWVTGATVSLIQSEDDVFCSLQSVDVVWAAQAPLAGWWLIASMSISVTNAAPLVMHWTGGDIRLFVFNASPIVVPLVDDGTNDKALKGVIPSAVGDKRTSITVREDCPDDTVAPSGSMIVFMSAPGGRLVGSQSLPAWRREALQRSPTSSWYVTSVSLFQSEWPHPFDRSSWCRNNTKPVVVAPKPTTRRLRVNPSLQQAVVVTSAFSVIAASASSMCGSLQVSANALALFDMCEGSSDTAMLEEAYLDHPTQLALLTSGIPVEYRYAAGCVIGNLLLVISFATLKLAVSIVKTVVAQRRTAQRPRSSVANLSSTELMKVLREQAALLGNFLIGPYAMFLLPSTAAAVALCFAVLPGAIALAAFGIVLFWVVAPLVFMSVVMLRCVSLKATSVPSTDVLRGKRTDTKAMQCVHGWMLYLNHPSCEWSCAPGWSCRFSLALCEEYGEGRHWYGLLEFGLGSVLCGVVSGVGYGIAASTTDAVMCHQSAAAVAWTTFALTVLLVGVTIGLHPFRRKGSLIKWLVVNTLTALILLLAATELVDDGVIVGMSWLQCVVQQVLVVAPMVLGIPMSSLAWPGVQGTTTVTRRAVVFSPVACKSGGLVNRLPHGEATGGVAPTSLLHDITMLDSRIVRLENIITAICSQEKIVL